MVFYSSAKYSGKCDECESYFQKGDRISFRNKRPIHLECHPDYEEVSPSTKKSLFKEEFCSKCFLLIPQSGKCGNCDD